MDHERIMDILSGRRRGVKAAALRTLLAAAEGPYTCLMRLRRRAYGCGVLPSHALKRSGGVRVPVISVGNITTGGTGKTPMVALVARHLQSQGRRPAVVMRGYRSRDGKSDEAQLLTALCNRLMANVDAGAAGERWTVPVITSPDRVAGAKKAVAAGAEVIVLDDAFQHLRMRRDLDLVLVDATNPLGFGRCLPRGLLREPPLALQAASALVITRADAVGPDELAVLEDDLRRHAGDKPIYHAVHRPADAIDENGQAVGLEQLAGRKFLAFCGIGNPEAFFTTLEHMQARLLGRMAMGDHAHYDAARIEQLAAHARMVQAGRLITTQKDYVKLADLPLPLPCWQLAVDMEITRGREDFLAMIDGVVG